MGGSIFRIFLESGPSSGYSAHSPRPALMPYTTAIASIPAHRPIKPNQIIGNKTKKVGGGGL